MCFTYEQKQKYNILSNSLFISVYKAQHIITCFIIHFAVLQFAPDKVGVQV